MIWMYWRFFSYGVLGLMISVAYSDSKTSQSSLLLRKPYPTPGPFVLFLHPHKAGGTTMCRLFKAEKKIRMGENQNCNPVMNGRIWNSIPMHHDLQSLAELLRKQGHNFLASEYKPLPPSFQLTSSRYTSQPSAKLWSLVTLLRHPVDRVISHYFFEHLRNSHSSILNWAHSAPYHSQNYYVRLLSGHFPQGASLDPRHRWTHYDISEPIPKFWTRTHGCMMMTQDDLTRAKTALSHFTMVLLLDRMEESLDLLRRVLGLELADVKKHENHQVKQKNITSEEYNDLLALNHLDVELFAFAHTLLDAKLEVT